MSSAAVPNSGGRRRRILVLGSLNIDLVQRVPRIPAPGETLVGEQLQTYAGGKGANQACAAALLGGDAALAGMLGKDVFAARLLQELRRAGVKTEAVGEADGPSGSATIFVLPNGDNSIVISPGANAEVSVEFAVEKAEKLQAGDFLLCQLETPLAAVIKAMQAAQKQGAITVLDPAPAHHLPSEVFRCTEIMTPNQTEAAFLVHSMQPIDSIEQAMQAARHLQERGTPVVIIKMGRQGCVIADGGEITHIPGFAVQAIDTTGAGDTFNAGLAVGLAEGLTLPDATRFANAAAALSVTRPGAIDSMPARSDVEEFLRFAGINN